MAKHKKKMFASVEEIFETYIPDYVKPDFRKSHEEESQERGSIDTEFTSGLLKEFRERINPARSSRK